MMNKKELEQIVKDAWNAGFATAHRGKGTPCLYWIRLSYEIKIDDQSLTSQINEMREALERVRKHLPALSARPNTKTELGGDIEYTDLILAKYPKSLVVEVDDEEI